MVAGTGFMIRKRKVVEKLQESGAVSEETAKTLEEVGINHPNAFPRINRNLVRKNIIVRTKDNKYYVNIQN